MRKDKLYLLTFLSVALIYLIVALGASSHFLKESVHALIEAQLEFGRKESSTVAHLLGHGLQNGIPRDSLIAQMQQRLRDTDRDYVYLSIIDWSGKIVCHPEIQKLGQESASRESMVSSVADDLGPAEFHKIFREADLEKKQAEVTFMLPVRNSDWIVVSHINLKKLDATRSRLRDRFHTMLLLIGLIIIPAFVLTTRYLGSLYEKRLELQKQRLEDEVLNLSKLNRAIGEYQQRITERASENGNKKRILTQLKNELLSVPIEEVAHIYTENTVTYVVGTNRKKSTSNSSLDQLFSQLDESVFFRANRQFIISIHSIDKIVKYGNNQLKILVRPHAPMDILIGKNKAAEFKSWLNS